MLANLRDLGRLAGWPLGWLAAAMTGEQRSSWGWARVTLPHVAALVAQSARFHTPATPAKHREPQRTLRPWRCRACWPLSRWISRRYPLAQRPERVRAWSAHEQCEFPEVVKPHLRSASRLWAGWRPPRCRKPGMQATARAHRRPARRYRTGAHGQACAPSERRSGRPICLLLPPRCRSLGFRALVLNVREAPDGADCDGHGPHNGGSTQWLSVANSSKSSLMS